MQETIQLGIRPVGNAPGFNHTFILYTNSNNQKYVFSGFPETDLTVNPYQGSGLDNGQLVTNYGLLNDQSYDYRYITKGTASYMPLATGADLSGMGQVFAQVSDQINNLDIDYGEVTQNSNSAVSTAILEAGLEIPNYYWIGTDPTGYYPGLDPVNLRAPGLGEYLIPFNGGGGGYCFPADTPIQLASGEFAPIASIRACDNIAAFNGEHFRGRGELNSKPVVRLFENITDTWIKLSWEELGGKELSSLTTGATAPSANNLAASAEGPALAGSRERIKTLTVTPGHHFLELR